jgi:phage tail sheath protein FI
VRPLEVAGTSTAAFVGLAEMGPDTGAQAVTSWGEFQRVFGSFLTTSYLAHSVYQYFVNGGRRCYIVRVIRSDAERASVTVQNRATPAANGLVISARSHGVWGNTLCLAIEDGSRDPGNEFRISVRRQADPLVVPPDFSSVPPLEVFDDLSIDPAAPNFVGTVLTRDSALIDAALHADNKTMTRGTLRGGGAPALPLGNLTSLQISLDGDGYQQVTLPAAATASADVAAGLQTAVRALTPRRDSTPAAAFTGFTATIDTVNGVGVLVLSSGTTADTSAVRVQVGGANDASQRLRLDPVNGGRYSDGLAVRRPALAGLVQVGDNAVTGPVSAVHSGSEGKQQIDDGTFSAAFPRLNNVNDFSLLAVPGENTPKLVSDAMAYCATRPLRDVFYLAEMAMHDVTVDDAVDFFNQLQVANSYAALYFPWVLATDPSGASPSPRPLPPSGFVAGLYGRIDAARGVWKAPAGVEAALFGVSGLAAELTDEEHGVLNPLGVDVIRRFPGAGVVAFGARTISSDPEWRYIPIRRIAIMLRVSIYRGIQWAVFEPNDETLWAQLRLNIGSFMTTLFRQGAFRGGSARDAFFVKCDADTTTPDDVAAGVVNVLVGFAPLAPAEFIVVKISQLAGQVSG